MLEQTGEAPPPGPPGHGWSRLTDQNASRPMPLLLAKFTTACALAFVKISPAESFCPIIGVMPIPEKLDVSPADFAAARVPLAALIAAAPMSDTLPP